MAKLKAPLLSLGAVGGLAKTLAFRVWKKQTIAEKMPIPSDAKSATQLSWRTMFEACTALWHTLSETEKATWEKLARPKHMTGYALWQSQCLRPNPGIYLPLVGGTMAGNIDMASFKIFTLPDPTDLQDPVTKAWYLANLPVGGYTQGARAYHDANQVITTSTVTTLAFNSERYDTDTIHDLSTYNSRLTCKTAGKYLIIGNVRWTAGPAGMFEIFILLNGATNIGSTIMPSSASIVQDQIVATIYTLAVNDRVELIVWQTTGVNMGIGVVSNCSPEFMMQRIG